MQPGGRILPDALSCFFFLFLCVRKRNGTHIGREICLANRERESVFVIGANCQPVSYVPARIRPLMRTSYSERPHAGLIAVLTSSLAFRRTAVALIFTEPGPQVQVVSIISCAMCLCTRV